MKVPPIRDDRPARINVDFPLFAKLAINPNCSWASDMNAMRDKPCVDCGGYFAARQFDADTGAILCFTATKFHFHFSNPEI